jgi:hypothetical protein
MLLLEAVFSRSVDPHSCWYRNGRYWCVAYEGFDVFLWESMTSEVNGSGLYVSLFWNTRLYLIEWAISFIVFSWICCLFNFCFIWSLFKPSSKFQGQVRHLIWACNRDKWKPTAATSSGLSMTYMVLIPTGAHLCWWSGSVNTTLLHVRYYL